MGFAQTQGLRLNCFITINASDTDCGPERWLSGLEYVRDQAAKWFAYHARRSSTAYMAVWVIESPRGRTHLHWLMRLPEGLWPRFEVMLRKWVCRGLGIPKDDAIHMRGADGNAINYLLKGQAPEHVPNPRWRGSQGGVKGKRCGVSQALGPAARQAAGWPGPVSLSPQAVPLSDLDDATTSPGP